VLEHLVSLDKQYLEALHTGFVRQGLGQVALTDPGGA
jgi:hypothetical protein